MFWVIIAILCLAVGLLKYIGILALIIIAIAAIYALFTFTKTKIKETSDSVLKSKKEKIVAELSEEVKWRQEAFEEIDKFFSTRRKNISFLTLITNCSETTTALERYEELESEAFSELKTVVLAKEKRYRNYDFPAKLADVGKFVDSRKKEIENYKKVLSSVAGADSSELDEIIESHCPKIAKENSVKRRKRIALILLTIIISLTIIIVSSKSFAQMLAENYHKSVLNENIKNLGYEHLIVKDIEYKEHTSYYDDDNEFNYYTTKVLIDCDVPYKDCFINDMQNETNRIYNKMDVDITYTWAGKYLSFNTDDNFIVIIVDGFGKEIKIE